MQPKGWYIDFSGAQAHIGGMDLVTVMAGVLVGNLLTVGLLWNIKKLDAPNPPLRNIIYVLIIALVVCLIGVAVAQQTPAIQ